MNIKGIEQKLLGHINLQPKALNFEIIHSSAEESIIVALIFDR